MRSMIAAFIAVLALLGVDGASAGSEAGQVRSELSTTVISFDDIAPEGFILQQSWNAMGMDGQGRVYIGFTSLRPDGREDFLVFRYDPATGERRFLGSFMDASAAAGNLRSGEEIPKGHTRMLEVDGRMIMGSQGFHDFKGAIDGLPEYRGAHLYAYDIAADRLDDISSRLPDGVVVRHQGIIALSQVPGTSLIAGLTHPYSDIVLFDSKAERVEKIVPGIPWSFGNPVSREIVATSGGRIYTYRGTEDPTHRGATHPIWEFDPATGSMAPTPFTATGGFWNGQTWTGDGRTIYLSTVNGELYRLDTDSGEFSHLGHFLPKKDFDAGVRVNSLYGIILSADEQRIYGIPQTNRGWTSNLYAYEIESGAVTLVREVEQAIYTGSHMRDGHGNIYFAKFGDGRSWNGKVGLLVVHTAGRG
ncbi:NHL repeat-containing protein [Indioceanicola profundi]|uniref:hypothetical protein n=1 Tax=Indioceanicola profundi TaxID=2220096 RepID=UPI001969425F|nr:hypothetical protein [Indioceanicola profundi]